MTSRNPRDLTSQQDLRATTAERLEAIVEAAERAAESVIDDAESQARRYLAQARAEADRLAEGRSAELAELIDSLLAQAVSLRREAERLQEALEGAAARIGVEAAPRQPERVEPRQPEPPPEPQQRPEAPRLRAVEGSQERAPEADARRTDSSGARLLATQLAVSGSSREEIGLRLRNEFQIEDTEAILDAILGPED